MNIKNLSGTLTLVDFKEPSNNYPIIVGPNLGYPYFLEYNISSETEKHLFELLVVASDKDNPESVKTTLEGTISLIPILNLKLKDLPEDSPVKNEAVRGKPITLDVEKVEKIDFTPINRVSFLENENYLNPQEYFRKFKTFGELNNFFKISVSFVESTEVTEFLKSRNFIMFDISQQLSEELTRINFHAFVLTKQNWKDFSFIQATDPHLAKRNDEILEKLDINFSKKITEKIKRLFNQLRKKEVPPLKERLINPNNQFRKLIKLINRKVLSNEIDFIVLTGDIIDFCLLSSVAIDELIDFHFTNTNWKIFRDIILNKEDYSKPGMIQGEELLCPIFTVTGNHDFRLAHYDLRWGMMYKKIGLVLSEAIMLFDDWVADPFRALTPLRRCLINYWQEINPSLDFIVTLGKNHFIFMNSGYDSGKDFRDLVWGSPSSAGMTQAQIGMIENFLNYGFKKDNNVFLFTHGPVINPIKKVKWIQKIKKAFNPDTYLEIDELKESFLAEKGLPEKKRNLDNKIYLKHGTITDNWQEMVSFCLNYCTLALCGHTHALREFRLELPIEKSAVFKSVPFNLKKIENPAAVFYDDYSEILKTPEEIIERKPYIVQTPAIGLGSYDRPETGGGYREIKIKNGKISSFKVHYLPK